MAARAAARLVTVWPRTTALIAGLAAVAALPPLYVFPAIAAWGVLLQCVRVAPCWRSACVRVFLFAYAWYLAGLYWVGIAFFADAERFGALAVPAVLALAAILAALSALPVSTIWFLRSRWPAAALAMAGTWTLAELLRGTWGVQFPWNPPAIVWAGSTSMLQNLAWIGQPGLSFATVAIGALTGHTLMHRRWRALAAALALSLLLFGLGAWRLDRLPLRPDPDRQLRLVQANVGQHHKWDPQALRLWFDRHVQLSLEPGAFDILVWPESSIPYSLDTDAGARAAMARAIGAGRVALVGSDHVDRSADPMVVHNSVYALAADGTILDRYDKVDLVPFGEFLPFRRVLSRIGLDALAVGSVDFSRGTGRRSVKIDEIPAYSPLVCYEVVFAGRATDGSGRARWLLNLTNDAWFGRSSGPYQHLAMARMRAIESGVPLVRAANTGVSVVTDAYGRVLNA